MTKNQIDYANYKETVRHNQMIEQETGRHNVVTERQTDVSLAETGRHNLATEAETSRHNRVTEDLGYNNLFEVIRHNKETESQGRVGLQLKAREVAVKERGQDLSEWSARFIPTDVETRRIQALASSSSASAALQQAGVASALLPYNQARLEAERGYISAQTESEQSRKSNIEMDTELKAASTSAKRAETLRSEAQARLYDDQAYHQEWLNQSGNLFLEQGQKVFGVPGQLIRIR
jgi:hypothetical protein